MNFCQPISVQYTDNDPDFLQFKKEAKQTEQLPYSVATHNCEIQLLQEREQNRYGVFIVKESKPITYACITLTLLN